MADTRNHCDATASFNTAVCTFVGCNHGERHHDFYMKMDGRVKHTYQPAEQAPKMMELFAWDWKDRTFHFVKLSSNHCVSVPDHALADVPAFVDCARRNGGAFDWFSLAHTNITNPRLIESFEEGK